MCHLVELNVILLQQPEHRKNERVDDEISTISDTIGVATSIMYLEMGHADCMMQWRLPPRPVHWYVPVPVTCTTIQRPEHKRDHGEVRCCVELKPVPEALLSESVSQTEDKLSEAVIECIGTLSSEVENLNLRWSYDKPEDDA